MTIKKASHAEPASSRRAAKPAANAATGKAGRLGGRASIISTPVPEQASSLGLRNALFGSTEPETVRVRIEDRKVDSKAAVDLFRRELGLSVDELSRVLNASPRTLERRLKSGATLDLSEGDRAYRLARIADLAAEMLGDADLARRWLRKPSRYMGGETPLAMLATEVGTLTVEQSLYAIGYGGIG